MRKKLRAFFVFVFCLIIPWVSLLTACGENEGNITNATEIGFSVFYDGEDVSSLTLPITLVKVENYNVENYFSVYANYSDGSKSKLAKSTETSEGFEIDADISSEEEIIFDTEYAVTVSYKSYQSYELRVIFVKPTLSSPVLVVDDEAETLSWQAVENATSYLYRIKLDGETEFGESRETESTTETSISLMWGWTVQVCAVGGDDYIASEWATMQTAWKPQRTVVQTSGVGLDSECENLCFEIGTDGKPKPHKAKLNSGFDPEIMEITEGENLITDGTTSSTGHGYFSIVIKLKNPNKYEWAGGAELVRLEWRINVRSINVPNVTKVEKNGDEYIVSVKDDNDSSYYTCTVTETEGGYSIKFTLIYKNDTEWNADSYDIGDVDYVVNWQPQTSETQTEE